MVAQYPEVINQSLRVMLLVVVPFLIVPVMGGVFSLIMGLVGIRDEGLSYAIKVVALIGVAVMFVPACVDDVVLLMQMALK